MTTVSAPHVVLSTPSRRKARIGFGDLIALTVRQHRLGLSAIVLTYVLYGLLVQVSGGEVAIGDWRFDPRLFDPALAGLVAVFWGAPLLAAEYEQHTNLLVWSQDVSPMRWLVAKLTLLGSAVVVLSTALTLLVHNQIVREYRPYRWPAPWNAPFGLVGFEAYVPLAIAYALFGLLFGVAVGAVWRRTIIAMPVTLIGFGAIRYLIAGQLRPWLLGHLIAPIRYTIPLTTSPPTPAQLSGEPGMNDHIVDGGLYLTRTGQAIPIRVPNVCSFVDGNVPGAFVHCMRARGFVSVGEDYQPYRRLLTFQLVELAIYAVFIAVCVGFVMWTMHRKASI